MEGRGVAGGDRVLFWAFLRIVAGGEDGAGPARDSKAEIRDWSAVEGMAASWLVGGGHVGRGDRLWLCRSGPIFPLSTMSDLYAVAGTNDPRLRLFSRSQSVLDFCLIPMGTGESSVAEHIAECQRVLEKSGLKYKVGTDI